MHYYMVSFCIICILALFFFSLMT